ncbi:MAG: TAXI family TRAP transporter solute-binding subunit [Planctomycetota bacterium]
MSDSSPAPPGPQTDDECPTVAKPRLVDELREKQGDLARTGGLALVVSAIGFAVAFWFVEPPPPGEIAIAAGTADGAYTAAAECYAESLAKSRVNLRVIETAGSLENYELLASGEVKLAIVQGGAAPDGAEADKLESLATLFLEPLWVVHRADDPKATLRDFAGCRVAVGQLGSGARPLAVRLLEANGVADGQDGTELVAESGPAALELVRRGDADGAMLVLSAESPLIAELLADTSLQVMSLDRSEAYARRFHTLRAVTLHRGVVDLAADLPRRDIQLVAPVANLVAAPELHDAFIPLLLEAAEKTHEAGGLLCDFGEHPGLDRVEFSPSPVARHYFKNGPSFLQRYLGFWVASLVERAKIMIVPLIVLALPMFKLWPPLYRWRIRSRIYQWYALLRETDQQLRLGESANLAGMASRLEAVERELERVSVPLSYMEEFYNLRLHIDLVLRRIEERRARSADHA